MSSVFPKASGVQNAKVGVNIWPAVWCWLATVIPARPREAACNEGSAEDRLPSNLETPQGSIRTGMGREELV